MPPKTTPSNLRIHLAHTLGFRDYPATTTADPYLNYISNRHLGRGTLDDYFRLFLRVVKSLQQDSTIAALLDALVVEKEGYFSATRAGCQQRREDVEDMVLYIIGVWTLLLSAFIHLPTAAGIRKVILAYNMRAQDRATKSCPLDETVSGLIMGSGILPTASTCHWNYLQTNGKNDENIKAALNSVTKLSFMSADLTSNHRSLDHQFPDESSMWRASQIELSSRFLDDLDSLESLTISGSRLNTCTLNTFGAVFISWTHNISRHMLLSKRSGRYVLEIFALPSALDATTFTSGAVGIPSEYVKEIRESYSMLFNAWPVVPFHAKFGAYIGIRKFCWCWSCTAHRHRRIVISEYKRFCGLKSRTTKGAREVAHSEFDPLLVDLMTNESAADWTCDVFPRLWSRITVLEQHLQTSRPWSIWVLFRDRRDTVQFWTFLFATLVVGLTTLQVALGVAQVLGSFR